MQRRAARSETKAASLPPVVPPAMDSFDPVALTVLAVNCLAPATMRSSSYGKALKVVVPDIRIGEVFRAALEQMRATRSTDRLIEIVIESGAASEIGVSALVESSGVR
jgi:hypothetical protein